jgi:hypothetical protein
MYKNQFEKGAETSGMEIHPRMCMKMSLKKKWKVDSSVP